MTPTFINPTKLSPEMLAYALGQSNVFPNIVGTPRKQVLDMLRQRRAYIRNLLGKSPAVAYRLPDFNELMADEIWQYAKHQLRPVLFHDWDSLIRQTPKFRDVFTHESAQLFREYQDAAEMNRPFIKHRYLSITGKRRAFAKAVHDPHILGEIEVACLGKTKYGLP
jgi:hypothetical protein